MRQWLKDIRLSKNMTCKDIALKAGVSPEFITMIENGSRRPSVNVAKAIATELGFDWTEFYKEIRHTA